MQQILVAIGVMALSAVCSAGEMIKHEMSHEGVTRSYFVYVPNSLSSNPPPVVFGIHGYTSTATGFAEVHGINRHAEKAGYIAVYPQGKFFRAGEGDAEFQVTSWNDQAANLAATEGELQHCTVNASPYPCPPDCSECSRCAWTSCADDVGFLTKVINAVEVEYVTDPNRYYLLGVSNGGMMAFRIACNLSHRFAAVAPIIGQLAPGFACGPETSLPMLHLYGGQDDTVRPDGKPAGDGFIYETVGKTLEVWGKQLECQSGPSDWSTSVSETNGLQCQAFADCKNPGHEAVSCGHPAVTHAWPGMEVKGARATCATAIQSQDMPEQTVCADMSAAEHVDWGMDLLWNFFSRYSLADRAAVVPAAKKKPHLLVSHDEWRTDNYYWLRDDTRSDPEIIAYVNSENRYSQRVLAEYAQIETAMFEEMAAREPAADSGVATPDNGYLYSWHYPEGKQYRVNTRQKLGDESVEVLIDQNSLAFGESYFSLGSYDISPDNRRMVYTTDNNGRAIYTAHIKNLATGQLLRDQLTGVAGDVMFAPDSQSVYYRKLDPVTLRGFQVYRHQLGTEQSEDTLVYEEPNEAVYTTLSRSRDDSEVHIGHQSTLTRGATIIDSTGLVARFTERTDRHEYQISKVGDHYYIQTNWNAENHRIMKVAASDHADRSKWQEVLAHDKDTLIEGFVALRDHVVVLERRNGQQAFRVLPREGDSYVLQFSDRPHVLGFGNNWEVDTDELRVNYTDMLTPEIVFSINLIDQSRAVLKQQQVGDAFNANRYASERLDIKVRDGVRVPVSLLYRKDLMKRDRSNPLYQYGYGAYGATTDPVFDQTVLSLVDRGFVYAIAHIRGGQMLNRQWYEDGRTLNKKNTFNDFVDVTQALVKKRYVDPKRLYASGASAGGLLVGASVVQKPDLYHGVYAGVPFVDVITTMEDASIPLTAGEWEEWGDPRRKVDYEYMMSYSPYDQIEEIAYPNMFLTGGWHDAAVQYFEPLKWIAKLREHHQGNNVLLLEMDMSSGHGGASGRYEQLRIYAREYAFFAGLARVGSE